MTRSKHIVHRIAEFVYQLRLELGYAVQEEGRFLGYPDPGFIKVEDGLYVLFRFPDDVRLAVLHNNSRKLGMYGKLSRDLRNLIVQGVVTVNAGSTTLRTETAKVTAYMYSGPYMVANFIARRQITYRYPKSVQVGFRLGGVPRVPQEFVRAIAKDIANMEE